jgi:hypothetical protein
MVRMKTNSIILTLFAITFICGHIRAQETLPYKAKAEFKQDTLQYLEYNFTDRAIQYKEKKVSDVLKDLDLPVLCVEECSMVVGSQQKDNISKVTSLSLAVHHVRDKINVLEDYYIILFFAEPFSLAEYKEVSGFSRENRNPVFTQKLYDFLKDRTVSKVSSNLYIIEKRKNLEAKRMQEEIEKKKQADNKE